MIKAPSQTVLDVYADYASWPRLFPTIRGVRLLRREGTKLVLEVDHVEGRVLNELVVRPPDQLDLWEEKRRYDARFLNRFENVPDGTRFTVRGEIHFKGWARLLRPFLRGYVRRRMQRLQLQPVKAEAEARARAGGRGAMPTGGCCRMMLERPLRFLSVVLVVLGATAPADADASEPPAPTGAIDQFVQGWMAANGVPGLAVAVTRDTHIVHLQGYGDAGNGRPVTPDTQFLVASLGKSFTALAVLQLVEAGRVNLDAPVTAYLPEFTVADRAETAKITVRMLLNQTSGMADAGFPEMTLPQPATIADRVASLRAAELVSEPGTAFHYFNPNYAVLARLVEVVSGRPLSAYLRHHVLDPLAMTRSASVVTAAQAPSAAPELTRGHILAFGLPIAREELDGYLGGSGGVISTARDMATWLILHNQRGTFQGRSLLGPRGIELSHTPPAGIDTSYAMGWTKRPGSPPVIEHSGVLSTFYAQQALLPDGRYGIVVLANAYSGLIDFGGLLRGLTARVTADGAPSEGFGARRVGIALIGVAALIVAVGAWRLRRLRGWAERQAGRPWRAALGVAGPFTLAAMILLVPTLVARFSGRVFSWPVLFLALPDLLGCLGLAAAMGMALGSARAVTLISHARTGRPA